MKFLKRSKGFSLIEMLIAMVLLAIALLALAGLMIASTRNTASGGHLTEAATFAQDVLEKLRAAPWDCIVAGNDTATGSTGITYTRNWTVAENTQQTQRWVTVTVNWTDPTKSTAHSINFVGAISQ